MIHSLCLYLFKVTTLDKMLLPLFDFEGRLTDSLRIAAFEWIESLFQQSVTVLSLPQYPSGKH